MDLRPPDPDVYAAAGGPVALNNPLTTCVVAGSRITIVRSFIGFWQCGQAQPSYAKTLRWSPLAPCPPVLRLLGPRLDSVEDEAATVLAALGLLFTGS